MPEFNLVQEASKSPTRCFFCHDHAGPFIDTFIVSEEARTLNHNVYVCCPNDKRSGCVGQMAMKAGFVMPDEMDKLQNNLDTAEIALAEVYETPFTITLNDIKFVQESKKQRHIPDATLALARGEG